MATLARLYFAIDGDHPEHLDAFRAGYDAHLAPVLRRLGILPGLEVDRPVPEGDRAQHIYVSSVVFAVDSPDAIADWARRLDDDSEWQRAIAQMGKVLHYYDLGLFRTTVGPGRTAPVGPGTHTPVGPGVTRQAGPGFWQGQWQSYGLLDGFPASISDIAQHPDGDLYLATREYAQDHGRGDGLWRFDGVHLQRWGIEDGLPSDQVICICPDAQGHLWIGTEGGGLTRYDGQTFVTYTTADGLPDDIIGALQVDHQSGHLWIGTPNGLCRYDGLTFTTFGPAEGLHFAKIGTLHVDREGRVWFGTGWNLLAPYSMPGLGLGCFDGATFTRYTEAEGLPMNYVLSLAEGPSGALWFGQSCGLSRFDGERFERVVTTDTAKHLGGVTALLRDDRDQFVYSSWGEGLRQLADDPQPTFTPQDGLASALILSALQDRDGQLWVGTLGSGLSRYGGRRLQVFNSEDGLAHPAVRALVTDHQDRLWIGTSRGINSYDGQEFSLFEEWQGNMGSLLFDDRGRLWFAHPGLGGGYWDGERLEIIRLSDWPHSAPLDQIKPLLQDARGRLFLAVDGEPGGLCVLDESGSDIQLVPFATDLGIDTRSITCMLEDRQGGLWFGGREGLVLLRDDQVQPLDFAADLPASPITALLQDRRDRLWIATDGDGLYRWDHQQLTQLSTADGLAHNGVNALLADADGHLWIGTEGGVSRYDGRVFQHLSRRDGLPEDGISALHQDTSGAVWIATGNGLVRYHSAQHPPAVHLTDLLADRHYAPDEPIAIPASQQLVTLAFQGSSLTTPPDRLAYCCRLQGRDDDWQALYANHVEYRDLPEGDYVFEVRAVDRDCNYSASAELRFSVEPDVHRQSLEAALEAVGPQGEFVGRSAALQAVQRQLQQVAPADLTVLIQGETGTGKGLAARALHQYSPRAHAPFIMVNCGAIPEALIESELFGHEKGAFTGATARRLGKVELARGGTLFLDEIGDLPLAAQVKFLQLLEERTFTRVGGEQMLEADVRVVAATNRDLRQMIAEDTFRQDLYFRLQGFEVRLPPLRDRREDIALLALYFIGPKAAHLDKAVTNLSKAAEAALLAHDWPGNVRELQHAIERAVVVCQGTTIEARDFMLGPTPDAGPALDHSVTLEENERRHIQAVLEKTGGRISGPKGAATILGVPESTLRTRMKKLGLK